MIGMFSLLIFISLEAENGKYSCNETREVTIEVWTFHRLKMSMKHWFAWGVATGHVNGVAKAQLHQRIILKQEKDKKTGNVRLKNRKWNLVYLK